MYENNYPYSPSQPEAESQPAAPEIKPSAPEMKPRTESTVLKKFIITVSLGVFFGICAGLGFQAVTTATDLVKAGIERSETIYPTGTSEAAVNTMGETTSQQPQISAAGLIDNTQTVTTVVTDVTEVVKEVMPAVVSVSNNFIETISYFGQTMSNEGTAMGSGFIVGENDTELLIVTNYHVVAGAEKLEIQFVDGTSAEAQVKGTKPGMDVAVLAVNLENIGGETLNAIAISTLGDSDSLAVGESAIAIGNSLGYGQSVTTGVISALDREVSYSNGESEVTGNFIQTDAAINQGNSGGALLNMKGEVVGINSNKIGGTLVEGMGYAIPISSAKPIIAELMLKETRAKVNDEQRGFLGITGITVVDEYAQMYDMPKGVYISQVFDGTAAADAGLVKGDIITEFDGSQISSMEELQQRLEYYGAGETVELTVMKGSPAGYESQVIEIRLGERASMPLE